MVYARPMSANKQVYVGTDCGATMSKIGAVWNDGTTVSTKLHQHPTSADRGREAVVAGWMEAVSQYLAMNDLKWLCQLLPME